MIDIKDIIDNKLYVGTLKKYANPKTRKYWADIYNDVVVINPEVIYEQLKKAAEKVQSYLKEGKEILVIHDKILYCRFIPRLLCSLFLLHLTVLIKLWKLTA